MGEKQLSRAQLAVALAPVAPPCFGTRMQWLEYVKAAGAWKISSARSSPLVLRDGLPAQFNRKFDFCRDCTHRKEMEARKRCKPDHLHKLSPGKATST